MKNAKFPIKAICSNCNIGFELNEKGECEKLYLENCTGSSILNKDEEARR